MRRKSFVSSLPSLIEKRKKLQKTKKKERNAHRTISIKKNVEKKKEK